ncbi:cell division protein ZapA [Tropicimonas sp. IMCC6043]|uniref:cell division protein ZapA n=1 Tax=Tropicimonas sp. IMCC6043 TaxID=2510645 RepID=UPI00101BCA6E|nr:cell division protein ZapA [Tropicimonas sp. IMCC6043]RYH11206.1 cell division protein ZapA [Tropicimonas sp. IMCC6043]
MPEVTIEIGGKEFRVACQEGEEQYLRDAAAMLDREARGLVSQIGRMPEARMLLMAGLMLADRTAAYEQKAAAAEEKLARRERLIEEMQAMPAPEPERVEVAVIPTQVKESLAELAAQAEALAAQIEEKAAG